MHIVAAYRVIYVYIYVIVKYVCDTDSLVGFFFEIPTCSQVKEESFNCKLRKPKRPCRDYGPAFSRYNNRQMRMVISDAESCRADVNPICSKHEVHR